jgi:hypothetical protein
MKIVSTRVIALAGLFLLTFAVTATRVCAQGGVPLWTNRYNDTSPGYALPQAIVADTRGYVFVTGWSGNSPYHFSTVAYSDSGVPVWTNREGIAFMPGAMAEPKAMVMTTTAISSLQDILLTDSSPRPMTILPLRIRPAAHGSGPTVTSHSAAAVIFPPQS